MKIMFTRCIATMVLPKKGHQTQLLASRVWKIILTKCTATPVFPLENHTKDVKYVGFTNKAAVTKVIGGAITTILL